MFGAGLRLAKSLGVGFVVTSVTSIEIKVSELKNSGRQSCDLLCSSYGWGGGELRLQRQFVTIFGAQFLVMCF